MAGRTHPPAGLELHGISKSYGENVVCHATSFVVPMGDFVCFLGPSGCGKTTLLRMIAGLCPPSAGRILMGGRDITQQPTHERNFGMVFQSLALFPHLSVEANIAYALELRGVSRAARQARVRELLELIQLPDLGKRRISALSGGQRQRVAIARALAQEPALFLLDEPLSALDAKLRDHMQVELRLLQQKLRITTILVTHDQREAMSVADRIVVMAEGSVQQIGSPLEIYRRPANRFVAGFIGQNNLLDVDVLDHRRVRLASTVLELDALPEAARPGMRLTMSVRPEKVFDVAHGVSPPDGCANATPISGRVVFVRDLGPSLEMHVESGGQLLVCSSVPTSWETCQPGHAVELFLRRDSCILHID